MIGKLHPLLVHLPIGILLLAGLFYWMSRKARFSFLEPAITVILFWGMLSAMASGISGFILSRNGEYGGALVSAHQWFGISVAVVSIVCYLVFKRKLPFRNWLIPFMVLLIIITGHLGGSITHGEDYLAGIFSNNNQSDRKEFSPMEDVQEVRVYDDIVRPIFQYRCYSCHNISRKKGELRLDKPDLILKGGKDGEVILPGNPEESEMIRRLMLPRHDEDHMPPEEKPQPKENEIALLHWWISEGAPFGKKVGELNQNEKIKRVLLELQRSSNEDRLSDVPDDPVAGAEEKDIEVLLHKGVAVVPVSAGSNYLSVNFVAADTVTPEDIGLLLPLKKQIVWLDLGNRHITDKEMSNLAELTNLTRLHLDHTAVTDSGMAALLNLKKLQYLNLVGTKVTANGISSLSSLTDLRAMYLYKTSVTSGDWPELQKLFPEVSLDSGKYVVPVLESDTTRVQPPPRK